VAHDRASVAKKFERMRLTSHGCSPLGRSDGGVQRLLLLFVLCGPRLSLANVLSKFTLKKAILWEVASEMAIPLVGDLISYTVVKMRPGNVAASVDVGAAADLDRPCASAALVKRTFSESSHEPVAPTSEPATTLRGGPGPSSGAVSGYRV
jgi:hypothetical protein